MLTSSLVITALATLYSTSISSASSVHAYHDVCDLGAGANDTIRMGCHLIVNSLSSLIRNHGMGRSLRIYNGEYWVVRFCRLSVLIMQYCTHPHLIRGRVRSRPRGHSREFGELLSRSRFLEHG